MQASQAIASQDTVALQQALVMCAECDQHLSTLLSQAYAEGFAEGVALLMLRKTNLWLPEIRVGARTPHSSRYASNNVLLLEYLAALTPIQGGAESTSRAFLTTAFGQQTALMYAASRGYIVGVCWLLWGLRVDPRITCSRGYNAADYAIEQVEVHLFGHSPDREAHLCNYVLVLRELAAHGVGPGYDAAWLFPSGMEYVLRQYESLIPDSAQIPLLRF